MAIVRKLVSIVAAAVAASVLASAPAGAQSSAFGDVADDDFYSAAVEALAASGVFAGTECAEQKLCPGAPVDRKTMAVWTVRVVDVEEPVGVYESRFDDVGADSFHAPFIERMADLRITVGCGDGSGFCPDDPVTRAEMAVFLTRAFSLPDGPDPGFADVSGGAWYLDEVAALAGSGITRGCGDGSGFCPEEATSRAQMAVFLHRAVNADIDRPTVRVSGGDTVRVPRGSMLAAEVGEVAVDAPAGTFSDDVQVTLAETVAGTGGVPEGEELATAPLAVSVTGAEVVRPMTLRFEVDTDALIPTGATPAWWSDELGTWVPLEADSMVIGDGVVTVKATLADAAPTAAAASASQVMVHAAVGAASGGIHPVEPVSAAVVVGAVVVGLIFVGGAAITTGVALSSDTVHDALKRFFGLVADEPECSAGLPSWVAALSDSDAALSKERARLHVCGETAGSDLRVKVVNNRNYGVVLRSAHGRDEASVTDQTNPTDLFEIIVKEMAQEVIGDSYIWPLTRGEFLLPTQSVDWHTTLKITESTAIVDGIRLGLDLLAIVLPEIDVRFNRILCIKELTNRLIDEILPAEQPKGTGKRFSMWPQNALMTRTTT